MNREFINYEQALALKELGFDKKCFSCFIYEVSKLKWELNFIISNNERIGILAAPTFSQAFRWFREKYELDYEIPPGGKKGEYRAFVKSYIYGNNGNNPSIFSYEEAELECLKKLIEIVKNK
jgi:hypothetical protein